MIITQFNRFVAKHGRVAFIVIGLVIVIPFVFVFGPGKSASNRGGAYSGPMAKIYGKKVDNKTFMHHMQAVDITAILQYDQGFSSNERFRSYRIDQTVKRLMGLAEARRRDLDAVSDKQVLAYVHEIPRFQRDGAFDREAFAQFKKTVLDPRDISGPEFDNMIRGSIVLERFESIAGAGVFVSESELQTAIRRGEAEVVLKYNELSYLDAMPSIDLAPAEEDVKAYFEQFSDAITLPEKKKILAAEFLLEEIALEEKITREAIENYYEERQEIFRNMEVEKAHERIRAMLSSSKRRQIARSRAAALRKDIQERLAGDGAASVPAAFRAAAEKHREIVSSVKESDWFGPDMPIPNVGVRPRLAQAAYELNEEKALSEIIYDRGGYYLACLVDSKPGDTPGELTREVRNLISERLVEQKIAAFYQEHVETYREQIEAGMTPEQIVEQKRLELTNTPDIPPAQINDEMAAFQAAINTYLRPYFEDPERKVLLVPFSYDAEPEDIPVGDEEAREYYQDNQNEYSKTEVKARHILLEVSEDADEKAVADARAKLKDIRAQIADGADFADMAKEQSEGPSAPQGGELGWFSKELMAGPFAEAAFATEPGEMSDIVRTRFGLHLIKVDDRREGRSFEEVAESIKDILREQRAERRAKEAAYEFAAKAYTSVEERKEAQSAAEAFRAIARKQNVAIRETRWFGPRERIRGLEQEAALTRKLYSLTSSNPVSEVIEGSQGAYVACWKDTREGTLPGIDDNPPLQRRVQRQMKKELALERVREEGRELHAELSEKLDAGTPFAEALPADLSFETVAPFKLSGRPPRNLPQGREILSDLSGRAAPTMLDPLRTQSGILLVYLAERRNPKDEELEGKKTLYRTRLRQRKQQALLDSTYARLQKEANLELLGPLAPEQ